MACFLTDLAKPYVEKLINWVLNESHYICCFSCIAKEFEEEKLKLESERTTVGERATVATRRGDDIQYNVQFWMNEAAMLMQEDTKTKQKCFFGFCSNCIWRYKRGKELAYKMEDMKKLMEISKGLAIGLTARLPDIEHYSSQYYIPFESRELKCKELFEALKDDNNYITGLQGMGGIGKTTLATEVGKVLKKSEQFTHFIVTKITFTPNIKKIQDDISVSLGLEWGDNCNESGRPKKLWKRLTNGEKILLILDDVWGDIDFDAIGIPYHHEGCRVLVITRNLWVCNKMGCGRIIQVELLSEQDAWIMFKMQASVSNNLSKSLLEKAHKIAKKCKGLPVAISVIASSLRGQQHREEWDVALKSLQKPMSIHGVDDDLVGIYNLLKFSYDNLKDEKAKRLFLLCSLFRADEEICTERLTRLGIGVGLFGEEYGSYEDARSQVVVAKHRLLDSCLLLGTNERGVKMHDLVREVARWIANKEIQEVNLSNKNMKSLVEREKNIKYLLCESKQLDVFSCKLGDKLEILIVDLDTGDSVDVPSSFFKNIAGLRVLDLSYQDQPTLSLLQSIHLLTNIRSLLISRVDLGDISVLGNLQSLETLDLVWCEIDELPHEITNLENFKLLKLSFCRIRTNNPFKVIERCSSLEELYFVHSFNDFCQDITLPALQRYHICRQLILINDSLSRCVSFDGNNNGDFFSKATLKYLIQTAEVLQLSHFEGPWSNLMPNIVLFAQGLNDLVELRLQGLKLQRLIDTEHIVSQPPNVFSNLVVLHLSEVENLEELCNGPLSLDSLNSLVELSIECCENLQSLFNYKLNLCNLKTMTLKECPLLASLFQLSTSRSLLLLEELKIIDCEQLKDIITGDKRVDNSGEEIVDGDNNKSQGSMFPKLKVLDIQSCPKLEFILPFLSAQDFAELETIYISSCLNLKYIFGQYQDAGLSSLKEGHLNELPNFISIFPECYPTLPLSVKVSPSEDGTVAPTQLDSVKCDCFAWTHICCYSPKHSKKLRSSTSTKISLVSNDQALNFSIASAPTTATKDIVVGVSQKTTDSYASVTVKDLSNGLEVQQASGHELTSSQVNINHHEHGALSTISETRIDSPRQIVDHRQKGVEISIEHGALLTDMETKTLSTHSESVASTSKTSLHVGNEFMDDGVNKINATYFANATEDGFDKDSLETTNEFYASGMEDIDKLIEEDPVLALDKLLTGKVTISSKPKNVMATQSETEEQSFSVGTLLQDLKTLMDSSSDLDHLVSNQESKSKLISLFHGLNQHQELLSFDVNEFVEKVQSFFNDHFVKHNTSEQVFKKNKQLLDSKTDLMNKLWSAKSTQTHIDNETKNAKSQIHEFTLQIDELRKKMAGLENQRDDLKSVIDKCDVKKKKLKFECTEWAQQSKTLLFELASSEVQVKEAECAKNLAKEEFANLKSSFPTF